MPTQVLNEVFNEKEFLKLAGAYLCGRGCLLHGHQVGEHHGYDEFLSYVEMSDNAIEMQFISSDFFLSQSRPLSSVFQDLAVSWSHALNHNYRISTVGLYIRVLTTDERKRWESRR